MSAADSLPATRAGIPPPLPVDLSTLRARYLQAQLAGNRREALRLLLEEGLEKGADAAALQLQVVAEAQREIGRLWQDNRVSIAQEHMATAISQVVLAHLFQHCEARPPNDKRVLVACVEGELHDFPARLVSDALELAGFDVHFLGANVPTDSLLSLLQQERPDLLALSVTMSAHLPTLRQTVERVRALPGGGPRIMAGGHALAWDPGATERLGVEGYGASAPEVVAHAQKLLGVA